MAFSGVSMAYPSNEARPVYRDLSFTVRARERVGIVGRTGAGKSSIAAVLFRVCAIHPTPLNTKLTCISLAQQLPTLRTSPPFY